MAMLPSHAHVECMINGWRILTWGQADPPYIYTEDRSATIMRGQAGRMYGKGEAIHGGVLTLHLAPHTPEVKRFIEWEQIRKARVYPGADSRAYAQIYNGTLKDVVTQLDINLQGGVIAQIPNQTVAGQDFTIVFEFERVVPCIDGNEGSFSNFGEYPAYDQPSIGGT